MTTSMKINWLSLICVIVALVGLQVIFHQKEGMNPLFPISCAVLGAVWQLTWPWVKDK